MTYDWSKFVRKAYIKSPLEEIYRSWGTANGMEKWFIKKADYIRPDGTIREADELTKEGDSYYWKWHQDLEIKGKVLRAEENKLIEFTFGKKSKDLDEYVSVLVEFKYEKGETVFTLTQSNMGGILEDMALYHLSCNMGWSFFMTNMKSVYEYGNDLRELDEKRAYETRAISL